MKASSSTTLSGRSDILDTDLESSPISDAGQDSSPFPLQAGDGIDRSVSFETRLEPGTLATLTISDLPGLDAGGPLLGVAQLLGSESTRDAQALQALKDDPNFQSLAPETQAKMLAAAEASPRPLAAQFQDLAKDLTFRGLPNSVQANAAEQIGRHGGDDIAFRTFYRLLHTSGFEGLREDEQNKLLRYVGGTNDYTSNPARKALTALLASSEYMNTPASNKTRLLHDFIENQTATVGGTNDVSVASTRQASSFTPAKDVGEYGFHSGKAQAVTHEVTIGDITVKVTLPKDAAGHIHTIEEVAAALAALPRASLLAIKEVVVEPNHNPDDPNWAKTYHDDNFQSYMTAGAAGVVSIYPVEDKAESARLTTLNGTETHAWFKPAQWSMDQSIIHESGHILSQKNWGSNENDPRWDRWKAAEKSDGIFASQYSKNSPHEDFAETLVVYMNVKGTKQEAEMRAMMPERFKLLDELLGNG
jgi:hypothetical protein